MTRVGPPKAQFCWAGDSLTMSKPSRCRADLRSPRAVRPLVRRLTPWVKKLFAMFYLGLQVTICPAYDRARRPSATADASARPPARYPPARTRPVADSAAVNRTPQVL